jgi:hypothetical protein
VLVEFSSAKCSCVEIHLWQKWSWPWWPPKAVWEEEGADDYILEVIQWYDPRERNPEERAGSMEQAGQPSRKTRRCQSAEAEQGLGVRGVCVGKVTYHLQKTNQQRRWTVGQVSGLSGSRSSVGTLLPVFISWGCCNKLPQALIVYNNRNVFSHHSGGQKSNIKVSAESGSL